MSDRLYADDTGGGGEALVLLHGFAASHRSWDALRAVLPVRPRLVAPDLPGHGRSLSHPGAGKAKAAAAAVLNELDGRGVNRFHLAGHSFGGAVAVLMASAAPTRVASLTLFSPGGFGPQIDGAALAGRAAARGEAEMRAALAPFYAPGSTVPQAAIDRALALDAIPGQREKLIEISGMIAPGGRQGAFPRALLEALAPPVRVVWGEQDAILPVRQADGLPENFAVERFAACGHMLPEEAPLATAAILRAVLAGA